MEYMWNPWHGCRKISTGCKNCYMFSQSREYDRDPTLIKLNSTKIDDPVKKNRQRDYKFPIGCTVATCFTSDFFLEEADAWRAHAWNIIRYRCDATFFIITKRISRFMECVPEDWEYGWVNVRIGVTAENQEMADSRIPVLLDLPIKQKGIIVAPILESVDLRPYLETGKIDFVSVGGESDFQARECKFEWVQEIHDLCIETNTEFIFHQTGTNFVYQGKRYHIPRDKERIQAQNAFK